MEQLKVGGGSFQEKTTFIRLTSFHTVSSRQKYNIDKTFPSGYIVSPFLSLYALQLIHFSHVLPTEIGSENNYFKIFIEV